jgi:DNA-binding CsgD family transcriptional regulator
VSTRLDARRCAFLFRLGVAALPKPLEAVALAWLAEVFERNRTFASAAAAFAQAIHLSARQEALFMCAVSGLNDKESAGRLGCATGGVAKHWSRIFEKASVLGGHPVRSQRDVMLLLLRWQMATDPEAITQAVRTATTPEPETTRARKAAPNREQSRQDRQVGCELQQVSPIPW